MVQLESQLEETDAEEDQQPFESGTLKAYQKLFQVTLEEADQVLRVLAEAGQEAIGSMGDDTPMPVLSQRALCTTTSASSSPRSPIRPSTRCASRS